MYFPALAQNRASKYIIFFNLAAHYQGETLSSGPIDAYLCGGYLQLKGVSCASRPLARRNARRGFTPVSAQGRKASHTFHLHCRKCGGSRLLGTLIEACAKAHRVSCLI